MKRIRVDVKKVGTYSFVLVGLVLAGNLVRLLVVPQAHAGGVNPLPYTAILRQSTIDHRGHIVGSMDLTEAIRSDGSRLMKTVVNGSPLRILDFSSGNHVEVRDLWELKSTR